MKRFIKKYSAAVLTTLGSLLIVLSAAMLISDICRERQLVRQAHDAASQLEALMPKKAQGIPDRNADPDAGMAAVDVGGVGYIGILQVTSLDILVPVADAGVASAPHRISGNAKAGTLLIGGSGGEYGKISDISVGDVVLLTDVRGSVWNYRVEGVSVTDSVEIPKAEKNAALTLTVNDGERHIVVICGEN